MPIFATTEARIFWEASNNRSRALAASRYIPLRNSSDDEDSQRRQYSEQLKKGSVHHDFLNHRSSLNKLVIEQGGRIIFAALEARLLVNTAGSIIENGGVCLDRNSGVPFIPGSAIKGAARRYAIWKLSNEADLDNKAQILKEISLIFGYGDQEWLPGRKPLKDHIYGGPSRSDFWLAMTPLSESGSDADQSRNETWEEVSTKAKAQISKALNLTECPNHLAGCISFLPAFPEKDPGIDLDILTSHHRDYYRGDQKIATDDESPLPLIFPAVPAGTSFQFPIFSSQNFSSTSLENLAEEMLKKAIETFGLGAKTNAGYGWFSIDHAAQNKANQERQSALEEKKRVEHRATLSEDELIAEDLKELDPEEFANVISDLENQEPDKQKIACQMLNSTEKEKWKNWRKQKKGKWPSRVSKIRKIAQQHNIDLS